MAKRRNQKKEKAARNLAYARQFRKKPSGNFQRGRRFSGGNQGNQGGQQGNDNKDDSGAE